jgi:hypothetical protein
MYASITQRKATDMSTRRIVFPLSLLLASSICCAVPPPRFPPTAVWHQNVQSAPVHPQSQSMIDTLTGLGGFGFGRAQIDFSFHILQANSLTPVLSTVELSQDPGSYTSPDCETLGTPIPVPVDGAIEGSGNYTCNYLNEDCHLLVVRGNELFELYRANVLGNQLETQCIVRWKLDAVYGAKGRGEHCTSADAAGFPIAPLLFNADEVAAAMVMPGADLGHAIRFVLPNARIANDVSLGGRFGRLYVRPASHAGGPAGPVASVPYGARLRLKPTFNLAAYNSAAQVILRTLQRYGMVLSDGGSITFTAQNDQFTTTKWADIGIGPRVFDQTPGAAILRVSDFEVLDTGARIAETYNCVREAVPPSVELIFASGFE